VSFSQTVIEPPATVGRRRPGCDDSDPHVRFCANHVPACNSLGSPRRQPPASRAAAEPANPSVGRPALV